MTPGMAIQNELMNGVSSGIVYEGAYAAEQQAVAHFKKVLIMLLGSAAQQAMGGQLNLKTEQEILMNLSDIIIEIFNAESTLMRVLKIAESYQDKDLDLYNAILKTHLHDATGRVTKHATDAIASFIPTEMQGAFVSGVRKYTKYPLQNIKENRRKIATAMSTAAKYAL